jgi:hypothetical protein
VAFFMIVSLWEQISFVINTNHLTGPTPIAASIFRAIGLVGLLTTGLWPIGSPLDQTLQDRPRAQLSSERAVDRSSGAAQLAAMARPAAAFIASWVLQAKMH